MKLLWKVVQMVRIAVEAVLAGLLVPLIFAVVLRIIAVDINVNIQSISQKRLQEKVETLEKKAKLQILRTQWGQDDNYCNQKTGQEESRLFLGEIMTIGEETNENGGSVGLVRYNNKNYFLACSHQFDEFDEEELSKAVIIIKIQHRILTFSGRALLWDSDIDFAFLKAPDDLKTDLILRDDLDLFKGMTVKAYGLPNDEFLMSQGVIVDFEDNAVIHNAAIEHGSSGGPLVVNSDGTKYIIGINKELFPKVEEDLVLSKAVPLSKITQAIKELQE